MIDWMNSKLGDVQGLLVGITGVLAIWFVIWTWVRTKALVPTLVAMLVAGAVLWAVSNMDWFKNKVGQEAGILRPPVVRVVDVRPAPFRFG